MAPPRLLFLGVLGEGIRRRDLGQHAGDDLIRQVLKGTLVVQRNELPSLPQSFFPGPGVAVAGNAIPLLPPFGEIDCVLLRLPGKFGGEDDLQ